MNSIKHGLIDLLDKASSAASEKLRLKNENDAHSHLSFLKYTHPNSKLTVKVERKLIKTGFAFAIVDWLSSPDAILIRDLENALVQSQDAYYIYQHLTKGKVRDYSRLEYGLSVTGDLNLILNYLTGYDPKTRRLLEQRLIKLAQESNIEGGDKNMPARTILEYLLRKNESCILHSELVQTIRECDLLAFQAWASCYIDSLTRRRILTEKIIKSGDFDVILKLLLYSQEVGPESRPSLESALFDRTFDMANKIEARKKMENEIIYKDMLAGVEHYFRYRKDGHRKYLSFCQKIGDFESVARMLLYSNQSKQDIRLQHFNFTNEEAERLEIYLVRSGDKKAISYLNGGRYLAQNKERIKQAISPS